jgi:hypothetical protein
MGRVSLVNKELVLSENKKSTDKTVRLICLVHFLLPCPPSWAEFSSLSTDRDAFLGQTSPRNFSLKERLIRPKGS